MGNDDIVARLHAKKYTREAWDEPYGAYDQPCDADDYGAEERLVNPDGPEAVAEIERLRGLFRLDGEQHAQHIKRLTEAHEARITKYATALAERDATIERLTREADGQFVEAAIRVMQANPGFNARDYAQDGITADDFEEFFTEDMNEAWRCYEREKARATTAERDLAEARAEVERKDAALRLIESWEPATQEITVANMMAAEARTALTAKGGEHAEG